MNMIVLSF